MSFSLIHFVALIYFVISDFFSDKEGNCPEDVPQWCDVYECRSDYECRGNQKCCTTQCGSKVCQRPVYCKHSTYAILLFIPHFFCFIHVEGFNWKHSQLKHPSKATYAYINWDYFQNGYLLENCKPAKLQF